MPLTQELRDIILQDFLDILQARYGDNWKTKLTSNMRPSPIRQIAEQRGVPISDVKKVRSQLMAMGQLVELFTMMTQPIYETPDQLLLN
jgi:hypothetical protein